MALTDSRHETSEELTQEEEELSRRGYPRYETNPSIPVNGLIRTRSREVKLPGASQAVTIIDGETGEIHKGARHFIRYEKVDTTRFVKLFLAGMQGAVELKKQGMQVLELVYTLMREMPNEDRMVLNFQVAKRRGFKYQERTWRRGIAELLERQFLFESFSPDLYFVNINFMFNGDRLAFIQGYELKQEQAKAKAVETPQQDLLGFAPSEQRSS